MFSSPLDDSLCDSIVEALVMTESDDENVVFWRFLYTVRLQWHSLAYNYKTTLSYTWLDYWRSRAAM